jgi:Putative transposase
MQYGYRRKDHNHIPGPNLGRHSLLIVAGFHLRLSLSASESLPAFSGLRQWNWKAATKTRRNDAACGGNQSLAENSHVPVTMRGGTESYWARLMASEILSRHLRVQTCSATKYRGRERQSLLRFDARECRFFFLSAIERVEKLASLVPPPRFNLVRYHGVLAPSARWRPSVVPSHTASECGQNGEVLQTRGYDQAGANDWSSVTTRCLREIQRPLPQR